MLQEVVNLIQNNRLPEARGLCEQICRQNKKNTEALMLLAEIYQRAGDSEKARNCYRKVIKLNTKHTQAHTRLAMVYHGQGKFNQAEKWYRQSLKLDNSQVTVHFNLGAVLQEQGEPDAALSQYRQAIKLRPDYAKAHANLAFILRQQGLLDDAIQSYNNALKFSPDIADIHYNLALALLQAGQAVAAEKHQQQALSLKPDYADAKAGLGAVQFFNGDTEDAARSYTQALSLQPKNIDILCGCANTLSSLGRHEEAMEHINKALEVAPDNADALIAKGSIHLSLGELENALDCCNLILKQTPQHEKAIRLIASVYEKKGDANRAYQFLEPLLQQEHPATDAVLIFAAISKALDLADSATERMEAVLHNNSAKQVADLRRLSFALGKAYDDRQMYDRAYPHYHEANRLKKANFDINTFQQEVKTQIDVFTPNFSQRLPKSSAKSTRPVFIVGMPRSGTSLVEQILASHPHIFGAGELDNINNLALSLSAASSHDNPYPKSLQQMEPARIEQMSKHYLDHIASLDNTAIRVTDKMPGNFMHLGLIQLLFPDARIIHCMRDPLDTCLSCYFQDFSRSHTWSYDLQNTGKMYLLYRQMMQHWKEVLNLPILNVDYAELVTNQQEISRRMIEFCDLEWDDNCMDFHKNKRFIWTASYDQVRKPMYTKSLERWKNYEQHIGPLLEILR